MKYEELTDKQRTGFDIIIKSLQKKYPFIVGWDEHSHWRDYFATIFIDLLVDVDKLSEYFNSPLYGTIKPKSGSSLIKPLFLNDQGYKKVREVENNIEDKMGVMYEYLPEGYNVIYKELSDSVLYKHLGIGVYRFIYNDRETKKRN